MVSGILMLGMFLMLTGQLKPVQAGQSNPSHKFVAGALDNNDQSVCPFMKIHAINTVLLLFFLNWHKLSQPVNNLSLSIQSTFDISNKSFSEKIKGRLSVFDSLVKVQVCSSKGGKSLCFPTKNKSWDLSEETLV